MRTIRTTMDTDRLNILSIALKLMLPPLSEISKLKWLKKLQRLDTEILISRICSWVLSSGENSVTSMMMTILLRKLTSLEVLIILCWLRSLIKRMDLNQMRSALN